MNWFLNLLVCNINEREIKREKVQMKPSFYYSLRSSTSRRLYRGSSIILQSRIVHENFAMAKVLLEATTGQPTLGCILRPRIELANFILDGLDLKLLWLPLSYCHCGIFQLGNVHKWQPTIFNDFQPWTFQPWIFQLCCFCSLSFPAPLDCHCHEVFICFSAVFLPYCLQFLHFVLPCFT